jgi:hypothetical protein
VARCSSGDPEGKVEAFEPCEFSDVTPLDDALMVEVGLGDPWVDVFRFDGDVHVGRRSDIWAACDHRRIASPRGRRCPASI